MSSISILWNRNLVPYGLFSCFFYKETIRLKVLIPLVGVSTWSIILAENIQKQVILPATLEQIRFATMKCPMTLPKYYHF